eukprot:1698735-Rhodomonas_salina.1
MLGQRTACTAPHRTEQHPIALHCIAAPQFWQRRADLACAGQHKLVAAREPAHRDHPAAAPRVLGHCPAGPPIWPSPEAHLDAEVRVWVEHDGRLDVSAHQLALPRLVEARRQPRERALVCTRVLLEKRIRRKAQAGEMDGRMDAMKLSACSTWGMRTWVNDPLDRLVNVL